MLGSPPSLGLVNSGVLLTCAPRFPVVCLSDSAGHRRESVSASDGAFFPFLSRLRRPFRPPELPRYPFYRGGSSESYKGMRGLSEDGASELRFHFSLSCLPLSIVQPLPVTHGYTEYRHEEFSTLNYGRTYASSVHSIKYICIQIYACIKDIWSNPNKYIFSA